jgi:hypothetical protein
MSAFGGKADMTFLRRERLLSAQSGNSLARPLQVGKLSRYPFLRLVAGGETARIHQFNGQCSGVRLSVGR